MRGRTMPTHCRPASGSHRVRPSHLSLRGVYLQGVELQDTNLSGALLRECVLTEDFDAITAVAISRRGQYWAAISRRGEVRVWREGGQVLHLAWQAHTDLVFALDFSPDERTLASDPGNTIAQRQLGSLSS